MTLIRITSLALGLAAASTTAPAGEIEELRDDQLIAGVAVATDAEDEDRLLDLMREVKARGLLMFPKPAACEFTYPDTAYFSNEFYRGAVRWAYGTELRDMAMRDGYCGCLYDQMSLDDFLGKIVGKPAADLVKQDDKLIVKHRFSEWNDVLEAYKGFKAEACGET